MPLDQRQSAALRSHRRSPSLAFLAKADHWVQALHHLWEFNLASRGECAFRGGALPVLSVGCASRNAPAGRSSASPRRPDRSPRGPAPAATASPLPTTSGVSGASSAASPRACSWRPNDASGQDGLPRRPATGRQDDAGALASRREAIQLAPCPPPTSPCPSSARSRSATPGRPAASRSSARGRPSPRRPAGGPHAR